MTSQEKLLLLGFGDIASRLSHRLHKQYSITGVRRRAVSMPPGVSLEQADCSDHSSMGAVLAKAFDVIVLTMTPGEMNDAAYQRAYVESVKTLLSVLDKQTHQSRLIIFVSSTGVYAQKDGEWIDEQSVTMPVRYSGKRLLEAETLLAKSRYNHCIVRFSGIYGPGRERLIQQVMAGQGVPKEPVTYTNRIHADDCAGVLAHLIEKQKYEALESVYIASDCEPTPFYEVKQWIAEQLMLPTEHLQYDPAVPVARSSKRCHNQMLLNSGYVFLYPTFKEGYKTLLTHKEDQ